MKKNIQVLVNQSCQKMQKIKRKTELKLDTLTALNSWHHQLIVLAKIFHENSLEK